MPSNQLTLCCPLLLLPSVVPSIRVLSNESALHIRWLKYWRFSSSISRSKEYSGFISFRICWFYPCIPRASQVFSSTTILKQKFFGTQLPLWSNSHLHMTTGKTIALTIWTFVGKVMSLLFKMVPRFVIAFLLRSKHLLISWLLLPSAVTLEPNKLKFVTASTFPPSICHEVTGVAYYNLSFLNVEFQASFFTLLFHPQ